MATAQPHGSRVSRRHSGDLQRFRSAAVPRFRGATAATLPLPLTTGRGVSTIPAVGITIKDVAREAGVSTATVSRVVNNDSRISPATRQRVLRVVSRLNYKVNTVARSLKSKRTLTVGMVVPEIDNVFFMRIARGVEDYLGEQGYAMMVVNARESARREGQALDLLLEKQVDGVIVVPSERSGGHLSILDAAQIPLVLVDRLVEGFVSDAVLVDNEDATYRAIRQLADRRPPAGGRRRSFGFIGGTRDIFTAEERYRGFMRAVHDSGISLAPHHVRLGDFHMDSGYALMRELLALDDRPDTVMVANYFMHIGAIRYISFHRHRLPESFFLVSFDNMEFSAVAGVPGMSIAQPIDQIGREAAALVLRRINGDTEGWPVHRRLATELIHHDTRGEERN